MLPTFRILFLRPEPTLKLVITAWYSDVGDHVNSGESAHLNRKLATVDPCFSSDTMVMGGFLVTQNLPVAP